ncbi:MAG: glycosyltransferase family 2 protein [Chlamydiae bacterium]|nr:glycosyltransferase family 2 protein [Chlamydiota bacterium]
MKSLFLILMVLIPILGFCEASKFVILILSYNNQKWVKQNLQSALSQDYENFRVIYVNDASSDRTLEIANKFIENHPRKEKVALFSNLFNQGTMSNFYFYTHKYIDDDEIVVTLDGDDTLAHPQVLKVLAEVYDDKEADIWITYGQYRTTFNEKGHCQAVAPTKNLNFFRMCPFYFSHLRTYKAWLFKKIAKIDFMYKRQFYQVAADVALMLPMMEMARNGHYRFIPNELYVYNTSNPISDFKLKPEFQVATERYIKRKKPYQAL